MTDPHVAKVPKYYSSGDYDRAIEKFDKAIAADPNNSSTYVRRAQVYFLNKRYALSFQDILKAIELEPKKKSRIAPAYIASQLDTVSEPFQIKSFKYFINIWITINKIKRKLLEKDATVTHYTSLDVLKKLLSGKRFRFYNATYMNDPEEGKIFFKILKEENKKFKIDVEKIFYENSTDFYSPAYIGSFTTVNDPQEDELLLWRTYGKQKNEDAGGACLIFKNSCFSENVDPGLGSMQMQEEHLDQKVPTRPCLYKVVYQKNMKNVVGLCEIMEGLANQLGYINKRCLRKNQNKEEKDVIRALVRELLDEIRFLFKGDHYSDENEMRVVSMQYTPVDSDPPNSDIKEDKDHFPPRLYWNAPEGFHFDKVLLGPQAIGLAEWRQWARLKQQGRGISIEKSKIPYKG